MYFQIKIMNSLLQVVIKTEGLVLNLNTIFTLF